LAPTLEQAEQRRTTVTTDMTGRRGDEDWVGWPTVVLVEAWRIQGEVVSSARRYKSSRLGLDAQRVAERDRGHGKIEHALHWGLDIAFRTDESLIRTGHAPETCAMLKPIVWNLLKQAKTNRHGMTAKRNHAGWDHADLHTGWGI
jgi:hypothetical protein